MARQEAERILQSYSNIIASEGKGRQKGGGGDKLRSSLSNHLDRQDKDEKKDSLKLSCWICKQSHKVWNCDQFKQKSSRDRRKKILIRK